MCKLDVPYICDVVSELYLGNVAYGGSGDPEFRAFAEKTEEAVFPKIHSIISQQVVDIVEDAVSKDITDIDFICCFEAPIPERVRAVIGCNIEMAKNVIPKDPFGWYIIASIKDGQIVSNSDYVNEREMLYCRECGCESVVNNGY